MERQPFVAGNWKMNMDLGSAIALAEEVARQVEGCDCAEVAICPPSVYLQAVGRAIAGSKVALGAQNMYHEAKGAFTGEISAAMLRDVGCKYVILGHSERRHVLGESDAAVNKKVHAALAAGLSPIVCVGETLPEREADKTFEVVGSQFDGSLAGLTSEQFKQVVIAYEPVWAIGTGKRATEEQAEAVHLELRKLMEARYNKEVAESVRIQYGGSVKADSAAELFAQPNIDGALVGGASLEADSFLGIVRAAKR